MSGHSKWSQIKRKKGVEDAKRGKMFTKIIREIIAAAKMGENPDTNPRLRMAVLKARDANMPADNIKRAIAKAAGGAEGASLDQIVYEGYGPSGVAILINVLTDNRNRTLPIIRNILSKNGGRLGTLGSVSFLFQQKGSIVFAPGQKEEEIMDLAAAHGAEDIRSEADGSIEVITSFGTFETIKKAFDEKKFPIASAEISMIPSTTVELDKAAAERVARLIETLEDDDDIQSVYSNANMGQ